MNNKIINRIFLVALLFGSLGMAIYLSLQEQEIRQKAAEPTPTVPVCVADEASCEWDPVANATSYHYKVVETDSSTTIVENDIAAPTTKITFTAQANKTYHCTVYAVNVCGQGGTGQATTTCPITPMPSATTTPTLIPTDIPTTIPTNTPIPTPTVINGLNATYFTNRTLNSTTSITRIDPTVNFNWSSGSPASGIPTNSFSVRWTGFVQPQYSQTYTFYTETNDGVRLWINNQLIISDWNSSSYTQNNSGNITLVAGQKYAIKMEYYDYTGSALARLYWRSASQPKQIIPQARLFTDNTTPVPTPTPTTGSGPSATPTPIPPTPTPTINPSIGNGLTGSYFTNKTLNSTTGLVRIDPTVNFSWSGSPAPGIPSDSFSVRWTGFVKPQYSQTYTFYTETDDGVRLWVNNQLLIDSWSNVMIFTKNKSGAITLTAGQQYAIKMEFYDAGNSALAKLSWSSSSQPKQIIPQSRLYSQ